MIYVVVVGLVVSGVLVILALREIGKDERGRQGFGR